MVNSYPWDGAGAPPHGLVIKYSTLQRCGSTPWSKTHGAIEIGIAQSSVLVTTPAACWGTYPVYSTSRDVIRNVDIHDNQILDYPRAGIFAANVGGPTDVDGIEIWNNTFVNSGPSNSCSPEYGNAVALESCWNGTVQFNTYTNYVSTFYQSNCLDILWAP